MKLLNALLFSLGFSVACFAEDDLSIESLMALGKLTGACGIMNSQIVFQQTTGMPEGDEFLVRYWTTEAARLGMTIEKYGASCSQSIDSYDQFIAAINAQ